MTRVYSRWAASPTSFGPLGRVVLTLLLVLVQMWLVQTNLIGAVVFGLLGVPLVLRDVWKRVPVHERR